MAQRVALETVQVKCHLDCWWREKSTLGKIACLPMMTVAVLLESVCAVIVLIFIFFDWLDERVPSSPLAALAGLVAVCGIIQSVNARSNLSMAGDDPMLWQTGLATAILLTVALGLVVWWLMQKEQR